jgi:very-short-patch-repair endonuclease
LRFGIELDGSHHQSKAGKAYDFERDTILKAVGASLIRFENRELQEIENVMQRLQDFATSLLRSRGNEGVTK